ncbi:mediator of RNA polymerase II transcription subunit 12-like protein [Gastrophryne carolinensis]
MTTLGILSYEERPLKRPRLGPPDVYPQDPKQKEDELTAVNVKQGFSNQPAFSGDEHGTAKNIVINPSKIGAYFSSILAEKLKLNTFQDTGKKKPHINAKDNYCLVTARSQGAIHSWFTDLAGNKHLSVLTKKVPILNKKEDVFGYLAQYSVPLLRATWMVKMTCAYYSAISEAKIKKRQSIDPNTEWTQILTRYLREQLVIIADFYHENPSQCSHSAIVTPNIKQAIRQWEYSEKLAFHMFQEGLLERHEYLTWMLEVLEKVHPFNDELLKMLLPLVLQHSEEFVQSAYLARRLAFFCSRRLSAFLSDCTGQPAVHTFVSMSASNSSIAVPNASSSGSMISSGYLPCVDFQSCPQHRPLVFGLSCILQTITLCCPSALVWNYSTNESKTSNPGSPLDLLQVPPSSLPMPGGSSSLNQPVRAKIYKVEQQIKQRGRAVEVRWSFDKCQESAAGVTISRVLHTLDVLDRHCFDRLDSTNSLDALYHKIFCTHQNKDSQEVPRSDEALVTVLCEWAVSCKRTGKHRAMVVAKLLEKRQLELEAERCSESEALDEKESISSASVSGSSFPVFQNVLHRFLDTQAPCLSDPNNEQEKVEFANLVLLFCELIRHEVFSHDAYMCTLISRGDLSAGNRSHSPNGDHMDAQYTKDLSARLEEHGTDQMEIDSGTTHIFDSIKKNDTKTDCASIYSSDPTDCHCYGDPPMHQKVSGASEKSKKKEKVFPSSYELVRHLQYATHFPIPLEASSIHECNQRMILLYGVGKEREEAKHQIKKITKNLLKILVTNCSGNSEAGEDRQWKRKNRHESFQQTSSLSQLQHLSYFDQHYVTSQISCNMLEQITSFASGTSYHLPLAHHVQLVFDLMETALNINGLIDFAVQLLNELGMVEAELLLKSSDLAGSYTTSLCLYIVAILRRYHACLILHFDQTALVFEGLCSVVKHVVNPSECSSAERCILAYLYDLYISCSPIRSKFGDLFGSACSKVKQTIFSNVQPSNSNMLWDPDFMVDFIENPSLHNINYFMLGKILSENAANRYSFVCNTLMNVCMGHQDAERIYDISNVCAELTACCTMLSSEWLGVLKALCCSSNHLWGFNDLLCSVDVSDLSFHDSLATFIAVLIARHCFTLEDVVQHVALPSLLAAACGDPDAEPGARMTSRLLLHLLRAPQCFPFGTTNGMLSSGIKSVCDSHLLEAAHNSMEVGAVFAVLKAILMLDAGIGNNNISSSTCNKDMSGKEISDEKPYLQSPGKPFVTDTASLSEYAEYVLKTICQQEWVGDHCLKEPERLCSDKDLILDPVLSKKQAQKLLWLICYPHTERKSLEGDNIQQVRIKQILQNLDQWTIRQSWLEIQLMIKQCMEEPGSNSMNEMNVLLDNIAKATIEVFQQSAELIAAGDGFLGACCSGHTEYDNATRSVKAAIPSSERGGVWLVAPLIARLPTSVQGRVLKAAGEELEKGHLGSSSKRERDRQKQKSMSLLSQQPFLSLVLTCLKGQDEQREGLLTSLQNQLNQILGNWKEEKYHVDVKARQMMHEALQLRLNLVGGMFDTVQQSTQWTTDWAIMLFQIITTGTVDMQTNNELFTTVLDMLGVLINGTLACDISSVSQGSSEENKRAYMNLVKKLKKELGDKRSESIDKIRQLLPLPKQTCDVITCEPMGSLIDTKGNKIAGFDSIDKKQGLQVSSKQKVSPWDLLEGGKTPAPLSLAWFGTVRVDRKLIKYEEQNHLLLYHKHPKPKPLSYYLEPLLLPAEEEEEDHEPSTPASTDPPERTADLLDAGKLVTGEEKKAKSRKRKARTNLNTDNSSSFLFMFFGKGFITLASDAQGVTLDCSGTTKIYKAVFVPEHSQSTAFRLQPHFSPLPAQMRPHTPGSIWSYSIAGHQQPTLYLQSQALATGVPRLDPMATIGPSNTKQALSNLLQKRSSTVMQPPSINTITSQQHLLQMKLLQQQQQQQQQQQRIRHQSQAIEQATLISQHARPSITSYPSIQQAQPFSQGYTMFGTQVSVQQQQQQQQSGTIMLSSSYNPRSNPTGAPNSAILERLRQMQQQSTGYLQPQAATYVQSIASNQRFTHPSLQSPLIGGGLEQGATQVPQQNMKSFLLTQEQMSQRQQQMHQQRLIQLQQQSQQAFALQTMQSQPLFLIQGLQQTQQQQQTAALVRQLQKQLSSTKKSNKGWVSIGAKLKRPGSSHAIFLTPSICPLNCFLEAVH